MTNDPIRDNSPIPHLLKAIITRKIFAGTQTEGPKPVGLVPPRDGVDILTLRAYLFQHAHFRNAAIIPHSPAQTKPGFRDVEVLRVRRARGARPTGGAGEENEQEPENKENEE